MRDEPRRPVFVQENGTRARWLRCLGAVIAGSCCMYLAVVLSALTGVGFPNGPELVPHGTSSGAGSRDAAIGGPLLAEPTLDGREAGIQPPRAEALVTSETRGRAAAGGRWTPPAGRAERSDARQSIPAEQLPSAEAAARSGSTGPATNSGSVSWGGAGGQQTPDAAASVAPTQSTPESSRSKQGTAQHSTSVRPTQVNGAGN